MIKLPEGWVWEDDQLIIVEQQFYKVKFSTSEDSRAIFVNVPVSVTNQGDESTIGYLNKVVIELIGAVGDKLSRVSLPDGWNWNDGDNTSYTATFKQKVNSGVSAGRERYLFQSLQNLLSCMILAKFNHLLRMIFHQNQEKMIQTMFHLKILIWKKRTWII